ncbi:hypothetical protein LTR53_000527 [Teratosphaeriaceae sp. CCFEE 6253]|nr:hypothetical protein LTR53_000527 [Teratosphaeriaceae sp. CCFEE 6253]
MSSSYAYAPFGKQAMQAPYYTHPSLHASPDGRTSDDLSSDSITYDTTALDAPTNAQTFVSPVREPPYAWGDFVLAPNTADYEDGGMRTNDRVQAAGRSLQDVITAQSSHGVLSQNSQRHQAAASSVLPWTSNASFPPFFAYPGRSLDEHLERQGEQARSQYAAQEAGHVEENRGEEFGGREADGYDYFICDQCLHPRPRSDHQNTMMVDVCEYCEAQTVGEELLHEEKWCISGHHTAMRFDFVDHTGVEHQVACIAHLSRPTDTADLDHDMENESEPDEVEAQQMITTNPRPGVTPQYRTAGWNVGFGKGRAPQVDARLPAYIGAVEMLLFLPNLTRRVNALIRLLSNGYKSREIAAIHLWGRGGLTPGSLTRRDCTVRKQVTAAKRASAVLPAVTHYNTAGYTLSSAGALEDDVTLASIASRAVNLPAAMDRGLLTQAVIWAAQSGNTTSTVSNIAALAQMHGWTFPLMPDGITSVLQNPQWDQDGLARMMGTISESGFDM